MSNKKHDSKPSNHNTSSDQHRSGAMDVPDPVDPCRATPGILFRNVAAETMSIRAAIPRNVPGRAEAAGWSRCNRCPPRSAATTNTSTCPMERSQDPSTRWHRRPVRRVDSRSSITTNSENRTAISSISILGLATTSPAPISPTSSICK